MKLYNRFLRKVYKNGYYEERYEAQINLRDNFEKIGLHFSKFTWRRGGLLS